MPLVDYRIPTVPGAETVRVSRSLASLQPIATATLHLIGWRFRRLTTHQITWSTTGYLDSWSGGAAETHHIRLRPSPNAVHLFVSFVYQAPDEVSGGSSVALNLYTAAGVLVDGPVTFDSDAGTLPTQSVSSLQGFGGGNIEAPFLTAHTGVAEDPPIVDRPRLLYVTSAGAGTVDARNTDCDLRVTQTGARIRSVTAWELPTQML